jgi:hypothetical protein
MSEKQNPNQLAERKRFLMAESERHRAQLVSDCRTLAAGTQKFANQARSWVTWVSAALLVLARLASLWRRGRTTAPPRLVRRTWLQKVLGVARLGWGFWVALRPRVDKSIFRY